MPIKLFRELEKMNYDEVEIYRKDIIKYFYYRNVAINRIKSSERKAKDSIFFREERKLFRQEFVKYMNFRKKNFTITRRHSI